MKKFMHLFLVIFLFSVSTIFAQNTKSQKDIRRQEAKVDTLFTAEEKTNMGLWLYERVNEMDLSDKNREEYDRIFYSYVFDMRRLDDTDKGHTTKEVYVKFDALVEKMDAELKEILTTEQYINHLEHFGVIVRNINNKLGRKD